MMSISEVQISPLKGKTKSRLLILAILSQFFIPLVALFHALSASHSWGKVWNIIMGTYMSDVTGLPASDFGNVLINIALLIFGYLICAVLALIVIPARITRQSWFIFILCIVLILAGAILAFISTVLSSLAYTSLNDRLLAGFLLPNSLGLIVVLHLLALSATLYYAFRFPVLEQRDTPPIIV